MNLPNVFEQLLPKGIPAASFPTHIRPAAAAMQPVQLEQTSRTLLLGSCQDGLPVLLDLKDPSAGAVLVVGDAHSGKTTLLQAMLQSLVERNSQHEVQYVVITEQLAHWQAWSTEKVATHQLAMVDARSPQAGEWLGRMTRKIEQRQSSRHWGPAVVVIMDGLRFLQAGDSDTRLNFEYLLQQGPACQVWPVAALSSDQAVEMLRWVNKFTTRIAAYISDPSKAVRICGSSEVQASTLQPGNQFTFRVGSEWLVFSLPETLETGDDTQKEISPEEEEE
jgi:hypothetical protein